MLALGYVDVRLRFWQFEVEAELGILVKNQKVVNPVKGDVSDSELNAGCVILTQPRKWMKEYPMLQKVILKSIKVMITCQKLDSYLKFQRDIEIWKFWQNEILSYLDLRKLPYLAQFLR